MCRNHQPCRTFCMSVRRAKTSSLKRTVPWPLASKYTPTSYFSASWCTNLTPVLAIATGTPCAFRYLRTGGRQSKQAAAQKSHDTGEMEVKNVCFLCRQHHAHEQRATGSRHWAKRRGEDARRQAAPEVEEAVSRMQGGTCHQRVALPLSARSTWNCGAILTRDKQLRRLTEKRTVHLTPFAQLERRATCLRCAKHLLGRPPVGVRGLDHRHRKLLLEEKRAEGVVARSWLGGGARLGAFVVTLVAHFHLQSRSRSAQKNRVCMRARGRRYGDGTEKRGTLSRPSFAISSWMKAAHSAAILSPSRRTHLPLENRATFTET